MYSWLPPRQGVWPPQPLTCTYLATPLLLPPIQAHSFHNRPRSLHAGEWAAPREYHLVERAQGQPLQLPDFVSPELRRAYGTYPRADVRVTQRQGQFLLQATPRVSERDRCTEWRVRRRPDSGDSGNGGPAQEAAERGRPRKSKGLS
uniref:Uncharacterized protein n=1 Tax=Colobus angolensis palliatus TaxID=336983 RepID=A0A2K5IER5_COLAP